MNTESELADDGLPAAEPNPIQLACEAVGTATALAKALGVTVSVISNWKNRGAPAERCREIEQATGGVVTRYALRPDVFGEPPSGNETGEVSTQAAA